MRLLACLCVFFLGSSDNIFPRDPSPSATSASASADSASASADSASASADSARAAAVPPRERLALFFQALGLDQVEAAYAGLVRGSILLERTEDLQRLQERTQRAMDSYGAMSGYEVLEEKMVGTALLRFTCLSLNQDLPLRWRFYFYRNSVGWNLVDLRVDDGLVELFEELGRPTPTP